MKVGYVRISCAEFQNTARQDSLMDELQVDRVFSISRIARSTRDFLSIMDKLNQKGVTYISRKESIDTSTPQGVFMMTVFAALAELERQTTRQRALDGIAEAKKRGVYKGRKPREIDATKFKDVYKTWKADKITAVEAYEKLGLSASTWYRRVKDYEKGGK